MKKILIFALATLLALFAFSPALGEQTAFELEGLISRITDEGVYLDAGESGEYLALIDDDTVFEGLEGAGDLAEGQYVFITYNGAATRSIPAQIVAQKIACYKVIGTIVSIEESQLLMTDSQSGNSLIVRLPDAGRPYLAAGMTITVYFDGIMAVSEPAQISARHIEVPTVVGTIETLSGDSFLLKDESGTEFRVIYSGDTEIDAVLSAGVTVRVVYDGRATFSLPAQISALKIEAVQASGETAPVPAQLSSDSAPQATQATDQ